MSPSSVGQSIPPETPHAVSVSLPTWKSNIGYEEGEEWVLSRLTTGYPRFFIHKSIEAFAIAIVQRHGSPYEQAYLYPSHSAAVRCVDFISSKSNSDGQATTRIVDLYPNDADQPTISAVIIPKLHAKVGKAFWQHTGEGISSRRAEYCHKAFDDGRLIAKNMSKGTDVSAFKDHTASCKGPKRYRKTHTTDNTIIDVEESAIHSDLSDLPASADSRDFVQFVEERFGRNLDLSLAQSAKLAIRRRIAGALTATGDLPSALEFSHAPTRTANVDGFSENDVYLFPCGMNAIYHSHRFMMRCLGQLESISYGFPYIDTLKILEKFGPGCQFYGHGSDQELDNLDLRCQNGEKFLALFCEFPGNPLLQTPDLPRIRSLADHHGFAVVVDETIGNFVNVHVLPYADIVVSSLTKVFTGECNVMGGSMVINPQSRFYNDLKSALIDHEDTYWPEDSIFMERNSRDFESRIQRINVNAEAICEVLLAASIVKSIYYPKHSPTRAHYDHCRNCNGGYGGLLSVTFKSTAQAIAFFDALDTAKGPSLGTNFTLSSPYVLLAHYGELDWTAKYGVEADLVRMSVGLEDTVALVGAVRRALTIAQNT